jgi:hypothetical protein
MRSPSGFQVDAASVVDLAGAIARAKADAWVDEADDGTFGLGQGCHVDLVLAEDGATRTLSVAFGAEGEGGFYARTSTDPAVSVAPKVLREMASRMLLDRSKLRVDLESVASVTLAGAGVRTTLSRSGAHLVRADAQPADDKLESALSRLYADSAIHTGPPAASEGFVEPTLRIVVVPSADAGAEAHTIEIGTVAPAESSPMHYARVRGIDASFLVPSAVVEAIKASL